ncbi:MAG: hypothetical protein Q9195_000857 [Heterodermia aff. obscurata]
METAIRWSPGSTVSEQRFLIADVNGRTFKQYFVESYDGDEFRYDTLSTLRKVPPFRAFDWSPYDESLIAIGQWSGEATVLRIDDEAQPLSLPIKHQRLCNAVAFGHNALLATGLERVRNDFCLNIWDINRSASTSPALSSPRPGSRRQNVEPFRQLASSEAITSIKFFSQPDVLVAGVKGVCLRVYDLRENTGSPSLQLQTNCVHNIAIDLLDENYFASAAPTKDSIIQVWDRRAGVASTAGTLSSGLSESTQQGPAVSYKRLFDHNHAASQASIWSLKYCKSRSGILGALASNGECKVLETKKNYDTAYNSQAAQSPSIFGGSDQMPQAISTQRVHNVRSVPHPKQSRSQEQALIACFDFSNLGGPNGRPCVIIMRADQSIDIRELEGPPPALCISSMESLVVRAGRSPNQAGKVSNAITPLDCMVRLISTGTESTMHDSLKSSKQDDLKVRPAGQSPDGFDEKQYLSSYEAHEHLLQPNKKVAINVALTQLNVARHRCLEGYMFDCEKNAEIVAHDPWLQEMWAWIGRE